MMPGKRFFLYCQHLAGTGHFVRTHEIALALAERHDVYLVDGGRRVPRPVSADRLTLVPLPRIHRAGQQVVPLETACHLDKVMRQRRNDLLQAIEHVCPDVLMIEHFPFSKWELHDEILSVIEHAKLVNNLINVVCSLRDIVPAARLELSKDKVHRAVLETLHAYFDLILVHVDPSLVRLEDTIPWTKEINVPIEYTGYVSQRPSGRLPRWNETPWHGNDRRMIMTSAGGDDRSGLITGTIAAWDLLSEGAVADRALAVFLPLCPHQEELAFLKRQARGDSIFFMPFTADFIDWLEVADLSISQAGYNTCTNLLQTRTRAILVPNPQMGDQLLRARLFAKHRLAVTINAADLTPKRLANAIRLQLQAPLPQHDIDLDGALTTCAILEGALAY